MVVNYYMLFIVVISINLWLSYCSYYFFFLRLSRGVDVPLPIGYWFGYISNHMPGKCPTQTHLTGKVDKADARHVNIPVTA
jgi:hypothetical protein